MKTFQRIWLKHKFFLLLLLPWLVLFVYLFANAIQYLDTGIYAAYEHLWSDWAFHTGMINIFAYKSPETWFAYHPLFADGKFTYGFLTNLISGLLVRVGLPLNLAVGVPSILFVTTFMVAAYFLVYKYTKSRAMGVTVLYLFFLGSGLGFINYLSSLLGPIPTGTAATAAVTDGLTPLIYFTRNDPFQWYSGNSIVGLLVPQRAFLLGITLGVTSLLFQKLALDNYKIVKSSRRNFKWETIRRNLRENKKSFLFAVIGGLLAGILPVSHAHTLIVLAVVGAALLFFNYRAWPTLLVYAFVTTLVAAPLYLHFVAGGIVNPKFTQVIIGWTAINADQWLRVWARNWGLVLPLVAAGIYLLVKAKQIKAALFATTGIIIFAVANIIMFQPIPWDNSKIFTWAYFLLMLPVAYVLRWAFAGRRFALLTFLTVMLVFTGVLDLWNLLRNYEYPLQMVNIDDVKANEYLRDNTPETARFLTAPNHNHPVMMIVARPILIGFTPWVMNFGFDYRATELRLKPMFENPGQNLELFCQERVSYIYISARETREFKVDQSFFESNFPKIYNDRGITVYKNTLGC